MCIRDSLKVAAHLRNAFPGDPDTARIREQAIAALTRAGERAERTGAPARAATAYATAAHLTQTHTSTPEGCLLYTSRCV